MIFNHNDSGKGNAILQLLKQFRVYPVDLYNINSEFDYDEFSQLTNFDGITIIIQAFTYPDTNFKTDYEIQFDPSNIETLLPSIDNISDTATKKLNDFIKEQISYVNQLLLDPNKLLNSKVVYLAGINNLNEELVNVQLPASQFLPWYLFVENTHQKNFRQPKLNKYFSNLSENTPLIDNLESFLIPPA